MIVGERQSRRRRGGKRVWREGEKNEVVRAGTLNVGTMAGKGRELADMMGRRKIDILCVQEINGKGAKLGTLRAALNYSIMGRMEGEMVCG